MMVYPIGHLDNDVEEELLAETVVIPEDGNIE
jgi:hypothetical protein